MGNITQWTQQQGGASAGNFAYGYDAADRLLSVTLGSAVSGIPALTSYVYDAADNRISEQRDSLVLQSAYNNLNQLTSQSGGGFMSIQGTVSKAANVAVNGKASQLNTNTVPPVFSYNLPVVAGTNNVHVTALDGSGNASTNNYQIVVAGGTASTSTYDADGNLLSDGSRTYQWDAENRLINIVQGANSYQFVYDGLGRRVSETDNGTLTKQWVWMGTQMGEERSGSNTVTKRFYDQGEQVGGTAYYYAEDHLGSIRELTDGTGAVQARYQYDSYGRVTTTSGAMDADFQYAGMQALPAGFNGTLYRIYDSNSGRWLSRDPMGISNLKALDEAETNQGANLYEYVKNSPVGRIDPMGLQAGMANVDNMAAVQAVAAEASSSGTSAAAAASEAAAPEAAAQPASEKCALRFANKIAKDLGPKARRAFHDAKAGADRTLQELKEDAQYIYSRFGGNRPSWMQ